MTGPVCVLCGSSGKRGRLLKCLHSLCVECVEIQTNEDSSLRCADCGTITPPSPLAGIPLLQFLPDCDVYSIGDNRDGSPVRGHMTCCDECAEDTKAVATCVECEEHFCAVHAEGHVASRRFYKHNVVSLCEMGPLFSHDTVDAASNVTKCPLHPSSKQTHYCMVCEKILCDKCLSSNRHDQHRSDLLMINQAAATIKDSLITELKALSSDGESPLEQALSQVDDTLSSLHNQTEAVSSQIEDFCMELKNTVDKRQRQLLNAVDDMQSQHRTALEERQRCIATSLNLGQRVKHLTENCISDRNFLKMCGWLQEATCHALVAVSEMEMKPPAPITLLFAPHSRKESEAILTSAGFLTEQLCSERSKMTVPAALKRGQDLLVSIEPRSALGDQLAGTKEQADKLRIEVTSSDDDDIVYPVTKATHTGASPPSMLVAELKTAGMIGEIRVSATVNQRHLQGSPAVIAIQEPSLTFDSGRCHGGMLLSDDARAVTHNSGRREWKSVCGVERWSAGQHDVSVRIDHITTGDIHHMIFMCNAEQPTLGTYERGQTRCFGWHSTYGRGHEHWTGSALGQPWQAGDVIHMSLDCESCTLVGCHERTGAMQTLTNVTGELCLYVSLLCDGDQVSIL